MITICIIFLCIAQFVFSKTFNKHRKNKEEAVEYLVEKELFDQKIYDEVEFEEVDIKSEEGLNLKGYLVEKYKTNKYIILVHGYSANHHVHMPFVRVFLNEGCNVLLVDQRSHGNSEGRYTSYGYYEQNDINLWIEFLKGRVNNLYLGLHGQSMGAATVLMCGSKNKDVKFIIEDCGYSNLYEELLFRIKQKNLIFPKIILFFMNILVRVRIKFNIKDISPIDEIELVQKPIMFIHGKDDKDVPYKMAVDMYNRRNNKDDVLLLVDNAGHMCSYLKKKKEYETKVHEFITKH